MSRNTPNRLPPSSPPTTKPEIKVEIRSFRYCQRGQLVGFAEGRLNDKLGFRNVAYFIPKDCTKKSFCKWPSVKEDGPHGPQYLSELWWVDEQTNYRILAHIARATEEYLFRHRPPSEARNADAPAGPPKAEIPEMDIPI